MALTTEELKRKEEERLNIEAEQNKEKLAKITPKFQEELNKLCDEFGVKIEPFLILNDSAIGAAMRIRLKENRPIEIKQVPALNPYATK